MWDLIEFRHLKYIVAIADTANFTRAAEQLSLAQPSLSKQIRSLEDAIAVQLFRRTQDGVCITAAGQIIADYAREALKLRNDTVQMARAVGQGKVPIFRIGFSCFVNPELLKQLNDTYSTLFPGCAIRLSSGDPTQILRGMEQKSLDGALLPLPIDGDEWVVEKMASTRLVLCMRVDHPFAQRTEVSTSDLAKTLKIFRNPESHPSAHKQLLQKLSEAGVHPEMAHFAATPADIEWMVENGYGLALIEQDTPMDSSLITRPIAGVQWTFDTAFVHRRGADHIALSILVQKLRGAGVLKPPRRPVRSLPPKPTQLELLG